MAYFIVIVVAGVSVYFPGRKQGRKGNVRTYVNLILTMVIGGLWHGASWTFVLWGLLHGIALAVHKVWMKKTGSSEKQHTVVSNILSVAVTFLFYKLLLGIFQSFIYSTGVVLKILKRIFSFNAGISQPYTWLFAAASVFAVATLMARFHSPKQEKAGKHNVSWISGYYPIVKLVSFSCTVLFFVFAGLTLCLAYTGGSPFIYGNF